MRLHNDLPREELLRRANEVLMQYPQSDCAAIHFKFTCEKCGERCTLCEANVLHEKGECYKCGHETVIESGGFMVQFSL